MPKVFITGGAGYVGSHCIVEFLNSGYDVVVVDNMVNAIMGDKGKPTSLVRVEKLTGKTIAFHEVDLLNEAKLKEVFAANGPFDCVVHFAALKSVGESCKIPLRYYSNNISGSINLLNVMAECGCKSIVFSSSATVYGDPQKLPVTEEHPTGSCTNTYGKTKFMMEEMMRDVCVADPEWKAIMLRYFNPVGAHPSGEIGEDPRGIPNNLMPYVSQVAVGARPKLSVFGNDYNTPDGTGVRDYIHVMDLATGHVAAVKKIVDPALKGWKPYNLGTGNGNSVLEVVQAFEAASGKKVPYEIAPRRAGDIAVTYADCSLATKELGWKAEKSLADMCADCWRWQSKNPQGFQVSSNL
ncbi:UDP-glucose 4-epimerase [Orchesella cincta]|uniref:UDP-glucose 4-epimerase n=1 Tax=Orchesella cincta TaxID=48709 RepID=A0A1D2MZ36_ORCCI|nr:UDP-glucose 4-epimerase [Orchesella cincta]